MDTAPRVERVAMDDHRYRLTACLTHRPKHTPGVGLACANPWCRTPLHDEPRENTRTGIRTLLTSLQASLDASRHRHATMHPDRLKGVQSFSYDASLGRLHVDAGLNLVVISGRRISGRRAFNISGDTIPPQVGWVGLDANTANPTETVTQLDALAANRSIKAFDAGFATITAQDVAPVKVTAQSTWTETDNPGPKTFVVRRIGLLNAVDNAARTLYSLLGGTTPSVILELNFTGLNSFTIKPQIEVTLTNQSAQ